MPENNSTAPEATPTASLTVDANAHHLLVEWLAAEIPSGYSERDLFYTIELFKARPGDEHGERIGLAQDERGLQVLFKDIDFSGVHVFQATVLGIASKGLDKTDCGIQFGEVTVEDGKVIDPESEEDEYDAHFNVNSGATGDPINMSTGSFSYQHTDLQIAGTPSFVFQTFYFSPDAVKSKYPHGKGDPDPDALQVLGNGWSHTYMTFLREKDNQITVYWGTGGRSRYKPMLPSPDGTHYSPKGVYDGSQLFYERKTKRYILTTHAHQQYIFDEAGRLRQILSIEGNTISLDYVGELLDKIVKVTSDIDEENDFFNLVYDGDRRLQSVSDNWGRIIQYAVNNKNLESYTDAMGGVRRFTYYDRSLMKTAADQNGDVFVYNEYKDERVVFQQDANAYALRNTEKKYGLSVEYKNTGKTLTAAVTDNMSKSIIYVSDSRGNLLNQETILSETTALYRSFAYDGFNNVMQETEYDGNRVRTGEGRVTRHSYDDNLNLLESHFVGPDGELLSIGKFAYNGFNQQVANTDYLGNTTNYTFNENHELERIEFPLKQTATYSYASGNTKGLVKQFTDSLGNTFQFAYQRDLLIEARDPYGQTTRFGDYDYGLPQVRTIEDPNGNPLKTTVTTYNKMGGKLSEAVRYGRQPLARAFKSEFTLDALGQVDAVKNPSGYATSYEYNENMKLVRITFPAVHGKTSELLLDYDRNDNVVRADSGEGVTQEFSYDAVNRCIRKTDGNGNSYEFEYRMDSAAGKPFTTTQHTVFPPLAGGKLFSEAMVSDIFGRPLESIGRDGQVTRKVYASANGRLKVVTLDPPAVSGDPKTQYGSEELFDELGRLIESTDREGNRTIVGYTLQKTGPNNTYVSVVTETGPLKIETILHFDSNGRVLFRKLAQKESDYSYDALGRLTASNQRIRNDERVRVAHAYSFDDEFSCLKAETTAGTVILAASYFNGMNQLVKQRNGLGTITERRYNAKGELSALLIEGAQKITYAYDKAGRNATVTFSDQSYLSNTYDKSGNCLETTQFTANGMATSKQTQSFDAWNRLEGLKDLNGGQAGYQYNAADQLTRLTYPAVPGDPGVVAVDYSYDNLQRLVRVSDWKQRATEYAYSPDGLLLKATFFNGVVSDYSFDKAQRLTGLKTSRQGMIILRNRWELDGSGNPKTSNSLLPLAPAAEKVSTFTYNLANQLTQAGAGTITYDANGNPASLPGAGNLAFNDLNLMTRFGEDEYTYDTQGLRAGSKINGKRRYYWTSPNAYQAPYLSMLNPSESKISGREAGIAASGSMPAGPQLDPLDQVLQITADESQKQFEKRFVYGLGLIAEESAAGDCRVYHFDERGSTVAMSDEQGGIVNRFAYGIYGGLANQYGERSTPFLYNGQQGVLTDANGLCSMRSRFYQPDNMRFLQLDFWLGDPFSSQSLNRYAYVGGNPIQYVDPLGLDRESGNGGGGSTWWQYLLASLLVVGGAALFVYARRQSQLVALRRDLAVQLFRNAIAELGVAPLANQIAQAAVAQDFNALLPLLEQAHAQAGLFNANPAMAEHVAVARRQGEAAVRNAGKAYLWSGLAAFSALPFFGGIVWLYILPDAPAPVSRP